MSASCWSRIVDPAVAAMMKAKVASRTTPAVLSSGRSATSAVKPSVAPIMIRRLRRSAVSRWTSGRTMADAPATISTLAMLLPTTFPRMRPGAPVSVAWIETTSSGSEVPKPTTVAATTTGGI